MITISYSPENSKNQFNLISVDETLDIGEQIKDNLILAHEQVLTRNLDFFRSVVFDKTELQLILDQPDCEKIRFLHTVVTKKDNTKYSSLIAVGEDSHRNLLINLPNPQVYVGTPAAMVSSATQIKISGSKINLLDVTQTPLVWTLNFAEKNLHTWLQTAFHDQKPVFLPVAARFNKSVDWAVSLKGGSKLIAFVPAIFHCLVKDNTLPITGDYCTYVTIGLDSAFKPVDGQFFAFTNMWRPNYPVQFTVNDGTGLLDLELNVRNLAYPNP
jgi:hypothetical protein